MPSGQISGDVIKAALRLGGAIATGETPTSDELNDGLIVANDLLEIWTTQNLAVFGSADLTFNSIANQKDYTIGPTGQWVTDRPVRINQRPYCTVGGVNFPIDIIGQSDYDEISLPTQPGQIVERMQYINSNPNGIISLWPVPNAVIPITMNIDRVLTQLPDLVTAMIFPPGYLLAFKYMLCTMLMPDYGRQAPNDVKTIAASAFGDIKRANKVKRTANYDVALVGGDGPISWQRGY